jgi:hypothetical protein
LLLPPRVRVRVRRGWRGREGHQGETARENWSGTEKREEKGDEIARRTERAGKMDRSGRRREMEASVGRD